MLSPDTIAIQNQLGTYCRTGELTDIPGINKKHIHHYRRLVFNAVRNNIRQAFPIASSVLGKETMGDLIRQFFSQHDAQTGQIWKLPGEFYEYALEANWAKKLEKPWLNDLLLFEWMELKVHTMPDGVVEHFHTTKDFTKEKLVVNPDHEIIQLSYPVHRLPVSACEDKKGNYFVLIFRHRDSGKVHFVNLSIFFAWLLEQIKNASLPLQEILLQAKKEFNISDLQAFEAASLKLLFDLEKKGLILGTKTA